MAQYISIGEIIRFFRAQKNMSQSQLASGICSERYVSKIENDNCIPTLDIINQFSDRLGVNLYDSYSMMFRHTNIETHQRIVQLTNCIHPDHFDILKEKIEEYKDLPEFQSGEPKQQLNYAQAIYASNCLHDWNMGIEYAKSGLFPAKSVGEFFSSAISPSRIELSLILFLGVNYCRAGYPSNGKECFEFLFSYLYSTYSANYYALNRNNHFEIDLLGRVVYNEFCFFHDSIEDKTIYHHICNTLDLLNHIFCSSNVPELLLSKSYLELTLKDLESAQYTYRIAHSMNLYQNQANAISLEKNILSERYEIITGQSQ